MRGNEEPKRLKLNLNLMFRSYLKPKRYIKRVPYEPFHGLAQFVNENLADSESIALVRNVLPP
jgi:hypothetical protein